LSDPSDSLQASYGRWLRVRAAVRALTARLAVAELRLRRDLQRSEDAAYAAELVAQVATERQAMVSLGVALDARIAEVKAAYATIDGERAAAIVATARTGRERGTGRKR
jgi:hypothetical protein